MPKVLILGGSFDPPHFGHISIARRAFLHMRGLMGYNDLWFMPCLGDMFGEKKLSPVGRRIDMLSLLLQHNNESAFKICDFEARLPAAEGTYAVMRKLIAAEPQTTFAYVVGTDQAARIREWRNSRKLLKILKFVVVKRNTSVPFDINKILWAMGAKHNYITLNDGLGRPISSTDIRGQVKKDFPDILLRNYTAQPVIDYIRKHNLYKE